MLKYIRNKYVEAIGGEMSVPVARYIVELMDEGMQAGLIIDAIDQTSWAPRPSPYYLRAILQRYRANGWQRAEEAERERSERRANSAWQLTHGDDLPF